MWTAEFREIKRNTWVLVYPIVSLSASKIKLFVWIFHNIWTHFLRSIWLTTDLANSNVNNRLKYQIMKIDTDLKNVSIKTCLIIFFFFLPHHLLFSLFFPDYSTLPFFLNGLQSVQSEMSLLRSFAVVLCHPGFFYFFFLTFHIPVNVLLPILCITSFKIVEKSIFFILIPLSTITFPFLSSEPDPQNCILELHWTRATSLTIKDKAVNKGRETGAKSNPFNLLRFFWHDFFQFSFVVPPFVLVSC